MSVTIYKFGTIVARATIEPDTNSQQSLTLMAENTFTLNFKIATPIIFQIGDYCYFLGQLYEINVLPTCKLTGNRQLAYTLVMESPMYDLGKVEFLFLDENNNFTDAVFSFTGVPQDYGNLLIANLNRVFPTANWILGNVIQPDFVTIGFVTQDFNSQNCLQALKTIASIFQTEYLIEGNVINIFQRQTSSGLLLQYGSGNALTSLEQDNASNANPITRLYAFGSTKNIISYVDPTSGVNSHVYRPNAQGVGSQRLRMGTINYLEKNINLYGVWESCIIFDGSTSDVKTNAPLPEIYPHRTGTVSAVSPNTDTDYFLNFIDNSMEFDVNDYLITGVAAQIVFNTGLLAGYSFTVNEYDNSAKKFYFNQDNSNPALIVPSASLYPQVGDEYVITNISLPQNYIDTAEAQLTAAAQAYLDENCVPAVTFDVVCNPIWFQQNNPTFALGQSVMIESPILSISRTIRIVSYTRNARNPNIISMKLADTVPANSIIVKLINGI
jgi:hypothetical protein